MFHRTCEIVEGERAIVTGHVAANVLGKGVYHAGFNRLGNYRDDERPQNFPQSEWPSFKRRCRYIASELEELEKRFNNHGDQPLSLDLAKQIWFVGSEAFLLGTLEVMHRTEEPMVEWSNFIEGIARDLAMISPLQLDMSTDLTENDGAVCSISFSGIVDAKIRVSIPPSEIMSGSTEDGSMSNGFEDDFAMLSTQDGDEISSTTEVLRNSIRGLASQLNNEKLTAAPFLVPKGYEDSWVERNLQDTLNQVAFHLSPEKAGRGPHAGIYESALLHRLIDALDIMEMDNPSL